MVMHFIYISGVCSIFVAASFYAFVHIRCWEGRTVGIVNGKMASYSVLCEVIRLTLFVQCYFVRNFGE